jgi:hypothetical protein
VRVAVLTDASRRKCRSNQRECDLYSDVHGYVHDGDLQPNRFAENASAPLRSGFPHGQTGFKLSLRAVVLAAGGPDARGWQDRGVFTPKHELFDVVHRIADAFALVIVLGRRCERLGLERC